jgi:hypothetical protein
MRSIVTPYSQLVYVEALHYDPNKLELDEFQSSLSGFSFSFDKDSDNNSQLPNT